MAAVRSERTRPTQQVPAEGTEQEAVGRNPTAGFEHGQRALNEARSRRRLGQPGQDGAQRFGLGAEAARPELAALVGCTGRQRGAEGFRA